MVICICPFVQSCVLFVLGCVFVSRELVFLVRVREARRFQDDSSRSILGSIKDSINACEMPDFKAVSQKRTETEAKNRSQCSFYE